MVSEKSEIPSREGTSCLRAQNVSNSHSGFELPNLALSRPNPHRRRLPAELSAGVESRRDDPTFDAERYLAARGFYPVHDAGAERHLLVLDAGRDADDTRAL